MIDAGRGIGDQEFDRQEDQGILDRQGAKRDKEDEQPSLPSKSAIKLSSNSSSIFSPNFKLGVIDMPVRNPQKQHERFLLERFIEAAGLSADIVEEREAPDFIVFFEKRFIGVEITELFISHDTSRPLPQAQESISSRIVSRAQQLYQASGAPPAHVTVCFGPGCDLRSLNRDSTATRLTSYVQDLHLTEWQRVDWHPEELDGRLPNEISFVHALGVPRPEMAHWGVARAGWVAPVTAEVLEARVKEKSLRLPTYQSAVRENWLVIVADGQKPSQLFDVRPDFDARGVPSPFSRTFFYGHSERAVIELGVGVQ